MSVFDDQARAAAERIRRNADAMAASHDPMAHIGRPRGTTDQTHRWLLVAASVVVVGAGVVGLLAISGDGSKHHLDDPAGPTGELRTTTPISPAPSVVRTMPDTSTPTTAIADPEPVAASITQPITDPELCRPLSATEPARSGLPRDPGSSLPLTLFSRPSELPIPMQVIADPVDGPAEPFAMVMRYFESDRPATGNESVVINGADVGLSLSPNGNGEAIWDLPDGSQGYLRSRGLDRQQLIAIVAALSPRPPDATIPGFDYGTNGPPTLQLVVDQMNTDGIDGRTAGSWCQMTPSVGYQVSAHQGDALFTYAAIIDRVVPPLEVDVVGDTVIQVCCVADPNAPTAADVVQADDDIWRQLLLAEDPLGSPTATPIGEDTPATIELVSFDPSTPTSNLTVRRTVRDGVAFIEVDTSGVALSELSEYWKIEIDGRIRSRSTAHAGGVMGVRLGDDASSTVPFTVAISTTDGDDITVQTTAGVLLQPTP